MADLNYFVCTLGQAVEVNKKDPHQFKTINEFLDYQARVAPDRLAVGFPVPAIARENGQWESLILSHNAADYSDPRLEVIEVTKDLWNQSRTQHDEAETWEFSGGTPSESDVAFYFHTSGTSTGLPKPIPQTHYGAVGVLPCLPNGHEKATFTTTPLYHGGIADCFRAWTSGALTWLFPGNDVPITASNILKCLECAEWAGVSANAPPVRYFSSVPYVLQMVSSEIEGLRMFQGMDIVGVGGAALPPDVGDSLVQSDANLVSRFGSAECGFLLSSHRDYEKEKEWQYLRNSSPDLLTFEAQQDGNGLSELVIQPQWPHMAKRNREDGAFATADLFAPHPSIENAWKYHSRADSQLTFVTGKKFDPAPLEAAIALSDHLSDVLIFGNGKECPGALLFRSDSAKIMDAGQLLDKLWLVVDELNKEGQPHTRLSRSMLVVMDPEAPGLEKSSKGTVLRAQAEKKYENEIQNAYHEGKFQTNSRQGTPKATTPEHEIPAAVVEIIKDVIGTEECIPEDADLFSFGLDSVACMAIRAKIQSRIVGSSMPPLPLNVVYDCGNIKKLATYLLDLRQGRVTEGEDGIQVMKDLMNKHSLFSKPQSLFPACNGDGHTDAISFNENNTVDGEQVLLTGTTGALGAHLLHLLRSSRTISRITCLVRAASCLAAHERVSKSLVARGKPGLPPFSPPPSNKRLSTSTSSDEAPLPQIFCLPTTFSQPTLGLSEETYKTLASTTTLTIHAAWAVNFTARLRSFEKDHIAGLDHLLQLTLASSTPSDTKPPPRFLFLSSTASVTSSPDSPIPERISSRPEDASPLGYSRSKWVAENLCNNFYSHLLHHHKAGKNNNNRVPNINVAVLRIGQLCGDTAQGIWNMSEAYPLMLSTGPVLGALPDLAGLPLDWLPVDQAAQAVFEVAEALKSHTTAGSDGYGDEVPVFHILNPHPTPTWKDLVRTIQASSPHLGIESLPPRKWLAKLEAYEGELDAKKLVGLWREGFAADDNDDDGSGEGKGKGGGVKFEVGRAREVSGVMRDVGPLRGGMLERMWAWVERQGGGGE
ncbi:MAG: hypothetical protein LQ338_004023 [Usnochroma carphineum]|nr:MAG: hypothetical protein LQ338_004023 [Usnochroma carphineum]